MYCIYWQEVYGDQFHCRQTFKGTLEEALKVMQNLRNRDDVKFVAYAMENPDMVGKQGVSDPPADYSWPKRRTTETRS